MKLRNIIYSLLAGFGATTVHLALMEIKHRFGILPGFEPYEDLQRLLWSLTVQLMEPPLSWLLSYVNGALILGFVFGQIYVYLPGRTAVAKGAVFGFVAWLLMNFGLLPLIGRGIFALELGLGALPTTLMLGMLMIYSITMSLLYAWLTTSAPAQGRV